MKYAALFRGINVGGKNIVKMAQLERLLLDLGLCKVKTYIQSGNAVFEAILGEKELLSRISVGFFSRFGFESNVIIRSIDELQELIEQLPFTPEELAEADIADPQVEHLYVYFLSHPLEQRLINTICEECIGNDLVAAGKRELYLLCRQSVRKSKISILISKTFDSATVRNWKTIDKLYDMLVNL